MNNNDVIEVGINRVPAILLFTLIFFENGSKQAVTHAASVLMRSVLRTWLETWLAIMSFAMSASNNGLCWIKVVHVAGHLFQWFGLSNGGFKNTIKEYRIQLLSTSIPLSFRIGVPIEVQPPWRGDGAVPPRAVHWLFSLFVWMG